MKKTPMEIVKSAGLQISQNVAKFGVFQRKIAALTSVMPPLICPTTLRPEPFSGRFLVFASLEGG